MKKIINDVLRLHKWRKQFNGDNIGYGYDQYKPEKKYHYAEAYAIFGSGYLKLYKATNNKEYLHFAHKSYDWLINNPNPRYKNLSWGLPWELKEWDASDDLSYLITTAFVANFLIDFHFLADKDITKQLKSVISWILDENGYIKDKDGILFYYANHEPFKFLIYNPSAYTAGVLSRATLLDLNENLEDYVNKALRLLIRHQNEDGSWYYSEKNKVIDNFHTALTLEGLVQANKIIKSNTIDRALNKGIDFYRNELFSSNGEAIEKISQFPRIGFSFKKIKKFANYSLKKITCTSYPRLWSYGASIRLFSHVKEKTFAKKIITYTVNNLQEEDGSFKFKENNDFRFIRNEAHIFDGMASYLLSAE